MSNCTIVCGTGGGQGSVIVTIGTKRKAGNNSSIGALYRPSNSTGIAKKAATTNSIGTITISSKVTFQSKATRHSIALHVTQVLGGGLLTRKCSILVIQSKGSIRLSGITHAIVYGGMTSYRVTLR